MRHTSKPKPPMTMAAPMAAAPERTPEAPQAAAPQPSQSASAAKVLARPVAGKTGTTNDSRDTWFIGYTPDIVVGTYIGFDTPKSLGEKENGGRVAIQGFIKFMQQAALDIPVREFRAPPGIREVPINRGSGAPLYDGDTAENSRDIIREAFLTGGPIFKPANELAEELKDGSGAAQPLTPEDIGAATEEGYAPPGAGEMAPYQRPVDPQGFDPNAGAGATTGTGGLY